MMTQMPSGFSWGKKGASMFLRLVDFQGIGTLPKKGKRAPLGNWDDDDDDDDDDEDDGDGAGGDGDGNTLCSTHPGSSPPNWGKGPQD